MVRVLTNHQSNTQMNTLIINQKTYKYPSRWNEINVPIFKHIAPTLFTKTTQANLKIKFLSLYLPKSVIRQLTAEQLYQIGITLDYLTQPSTEHDLLPQFRHRFQTYHSPGARLQYCTLHEFSYADTFFYYYQKKQKPEFLHRFIATIYRPAGKTETKGDLRTPFNPADLDEQIRHIKTLPAIQIQIILTYFVSCKTYYTQKYKELFTAPKTATEAKVPDWNGLILDLCDRDLTRLETIGKLLFPVALTYLEKSRQDAETLKAKTT